MKKQNSPLMSIFRTISLAATASVVLCLTTACQESRMERFERETAEFTRKNCPQRIDDDVIILDSLVFHNDGSLNYINYYTVFADSLQVDYLKERRGELRESLLKGVINSVELKNVKAAELNIIHRYYTADTHQLIFEFRFTPKDYGTSREVENE